MNNFSAKIYLIISCLFFFTIASCSQSLEPPPPSFFEDDAPSANAQANERVPDFYPTPGQIQRPPSSETVSQNSAPAASSAAPLYPPMARPDAAQIADQTQIANPNLAPEIPANQYLDPNAVPNQMAEQNLYSDSNQAQPNPTELAPQDQFSNPALNQNPAPLPNFLDPRQPQPSNPAFDPNQRRAPLLNQFDLMAQQAPNMAPQPPSQLPTPDPEDDTPLTEDNCKIDEVTFKAILQRVKTKTPKAIEELVDCLKLNRKLMLRAAIIDPSQFQYASDILKEDETFVRRMIEINPEVLKFASSKLRSDRFFMERATYLNRDSLQYADAKLLDNKLFMKRMIDIDARNYLFASDRLKAVPEIAELAFKDDGLLLEKAPITIKSDKKLVTLAVRSNADALQFASDELRQSKDLKKLAIKKSSIKSEKILKKFLRENYINDSNKKNVGYVIDNRMKYYKDSAIIDRNYVSKWQRTFDKNSDELRLIAADSRNYPISWKEDFKKFPLLVKKIEKFLASHNVAQNTINKLSTTFFWKVKKNPQTVVFNLYLMRDTKDADLGTKFDDITSLTAVAQKHGEDWDLSVLQVIFDNEIKVELAYENGHKKYELWDLYVNDKSDNNPKIIFKVEDRFSDYFEIFEEQNNGKYRMTYREDSLKDAAEYKKEDQDWTYGDELY